MPIRRRKTAYTVRDPGNPRDVALCAFLEITENRRKSHTMLKEAFEANAAAADPLDARDRAFVSRIVIGSLDRMITIDTVLSRFLKRPLSLVKPLARGVLRISVYQLLYMDKVPESAACNEGVALCRLHGMEGLSGFINGVLRAVSREKAANGPKVTEFPELWQRVSVPKWLAAKLAADYGDDRAEAVLEAFLSERPETIRLNLSLASEAEIIQSLQKDGQQLEKTDLAALLQEADAPMPAGALPAVYSLKHTGDITKTAAFQKGWIFVQDAASALVAAYADPAPGDEIFDVCAAPGGKSLAVADALRCMQGAGRVEARDVSGQKVALIEENIRRTGFSNIRTRVQNALTEDEESFYRADIVLADLPCSGLGVIARKPDIKLNLEEYSIRELQQLQRDILMVTSRYVRPKGKLVYSTCTITPEENEQNTRWAAEHLGFTLLSEASLLPTGQHDGFYIAVLEKHY